MTVSRASLVALIFLFVCYVSTRRAMTREKQFIAVVAPSRSLASWRAVENSSIYTTLIPSLESSLNSVELNTLSLALFVVFDKGDAFWEDGVIRSRVENSVSGHLAIHFVSVKKTSRIPFNEGCLLAYELGADYIVRVNDDTQFIGMGWITAGIDALESFKPKNLGVVGPVCKQGNKRILTHDMVHRSHLDIFDEYYPKEFDNWWIDDWISNVYGPSHTKRLSDWVVIHHTNKYGQRYTENKTQALLMPEILVHTKQQIIDFITLNVGSKRRVTLRSSDIVKIYSRTLTS